VCSLRYPGCNAHAPSCLLWPAPLQNIFPHYLINMRDFRGKKVIEPKLCVLIFSTTFDEIFLILRRRERDIIININRSSCKVPVILIRF
jgi:hypothetical protein